MLFKEQLRVNRLTLGNRIVMPPMATARAVDGAPGEGLAEDYYGARARGTGLVIVEHAYIMPQGMAHRNQLSMADDALIPAFQKLTDAVHKQGAKVFAQLNHAGAKATYTGMQIVGPSAVAYKDGDIPAELSSDQIKEITAAFAAAAERVRKAGFDGVEIHAAHGYLLNQFYSPLMNHREDEYSAATIENRTRLHCEVLRAVRDTVGGDYTLAIRFGACDYMDGGSRIEEIPDAVKYYQSAGADMIDISGGMTGFMRPGHTEPGYFKELGLAAKSAARVPILLTGGVMTARDAERLLRDGAADLVGVGRAMLNDPDWSIKALQAQESYSAL